MTIATDETSLQELLGRALVRIRALKKQVSALESRVAAPIAVIGMSCRFPGDAADLDGYWRVLVEGRNAVTELPPARRQHHDLPIEAAGVRWAACLRDVEGFDPGFFDISPREARSLDPQQRLLLELAWETLEHAAMPVERLRGSRTGVFVGMTSRDYRDVIAAGGLGGLDTYAGTGTENCFAAGRLAFALGLNGPTMVVDTACSSALVALHLACQSLRARECDVALAGAVNLLLSPIMLQTIGLLGVLSPDGRCHAFDARANGYVRGEGGGVVALKRLSDAVRDGDPIVMVVRGSAVNQDGASAGLTAPNASAQRALLEEAYAIAGVEPHEVDCIEAHGTGTQIGDPIEVEALVEAFAGVAGPILVGSAKTNVGHLEAAAGMAGLFKAALAMRHEMIPANAGFEQLNPHIALDDTALRIAATNEPWPRRPDKPRIAGISAFGMSGTNAHVVVEEAPARPDEVTSTKAPGPDLLLLSAKTDSALRVLAGRWADYVASSAAPLEDIVHTAAAGRTQHRHRLAVIAETRDELCSALQREAGQSSSALRGTTARIQPRVAFVFSGQGSQYVGMGRGLYTHAPVFRDVIDRCAAHAALDVPLLSLLYPEDGASPLARTAYTHPALFALQCALVAQWRDWGVEPDFVIGHSLGEYAAAVTAGVIGLLDGLDLVIARGQLLEETPPGAMASVDDASEALRDLVSGASSELAVAAYNTKTQEVLSGEPAAVARAIASLTARGVKVRELPVRTAFHSPLVDAVTEPFSRRVAAHELQAPTTPMISTVDASADGEGFRAPRYWARQIRQPVRFADAIHEAQRRGAEVFVEIGPHTTLAGMIGQILPLGRERLLPSLQRGKADQATLSRALGGLHVIGATDAASVVARRGGRRIAAPTYPFERERFWAEPRESHLTLSSEAELVVFTDVNSERPSYVGDHRVDDVVVVPAVTYLERVLAAARVVVGPRAVLRNVTFERALALREGEGHRLSVICKRVDGQLEFLVESARAGVAKSTLHARGRIEVGTSRPVALDLTKIETHGQLDGEALYARLEAAGQQYGPHFRRIRSLGWGHDEVLARIDTDRARAADDEIFAPEVLDACLQSLVALDGPPTPSGARVPVAIEGLELHAPLADAAWAHARRRRDDADGLCDITVTDKEGDVLARVLGLRVAALASDVQPDAAAMYRLAWEALPPLQARMRGEEAQRSMSRTSAPASSASSTAGPHRTAICAPHRDAAVEELARALRDAGETVTWIAVERDDAQASLDVDRVIFVETTEDTVEGQRASYGAALALSQGLAASAARDLPRLWLVTRGAQGVLDDDVVMPSTLWGLGRTLAYELSATSPTLVDWPRRPRQRDAEILAHTIVAEVPDDQLAVRGERLLAGRLRSAPLRPARATVSAERCHLITGGLKGLGLALAEHLVFRGARRLVLVGRSEPDQQAARAVSAMQRRGAEVVIVQADVSERDALHRALTQARQLAPLAAVVHAAGVVDDALLPAQSLERFDRVMAAKVAGSFHLRELLADEPDVWLVLYSSAASLLGSAGQANYAAANAYMDGVAEQRRRRGGRAASISWGAFSEVGMAARLEETAHLALRGISAMSPREGAERLLDLLHGEHPAHVGIMQIDFRQWMEMFPTVAGRSSFAAVAAGGGPRGGHALQAALATAEPGRRLTITVDCVRAEVAAVLQLDADRVDPARPFSELGLDSLMGLELRNRLEAATGLRLSAALLWAHQDAAALGEHLLRQLDVIEAPPSESPKPAEPRVLLSESEVEALTEDEASLLLERALAEMEGAR